MEKKKNINKINAEYKFFCEVHWFYPVCPTFFQTWFACQFCVSLCKPCCKKKKKKKRLKKGNKKKDNHKTKYYKTNKLSVLKNKITELHFSLYLKLSQTQGTEKIMNYYYSLGEWQKGFKFY